MRTHQAVHVESANGPLQLVEVEPTPPPTGHVRIEVHACVICGTDREFVHGGFPNITWPLTPGHEIARPIAELGDSVEAFTSRRYRIRAQVQEHPLRQAALAYSAMEEGHAQYRMVLTM
jgi:D-arabinose 1-dehydrogenase-like Zn-dependent alcohol dehydrogenase